MNDFHADDAWQRSVRDEILVPQLYAKRAEGGRYVTVDKGKMARVLQRHAVDTVLQGKNGLAICVEEKIVRWKGRRYTAFALETKSCTLAGLESPGWMFYGEADYLLYCFQLENKSLDCWLIEFEPLRKWFWPVHERYSVFKMKERNMTEGRVVPIDDVVASVRAWHFGLSA